MSAPTEGLCPKCAHWAAGAVCCHSHCPGLKLWREEDRKAPTNHPDTITEHAA